jgi:hypothetical protein
MCGAAVCQNHSRGMCLQEAIDGMEFPLHSPSGSLLPLIHVSVCHARDDRRRILGIGQKTRRFQQTYDGIGAQCPVKNRNYIIVVSTDGVACLVGDGNSEDWDIAVGRQEAEQVMIDFLWLP